MQGLTDSMEQGATVIIVELKASPGTVFEVEGVDGVVEATGRANDRNGAVAEAVDLVQAAGLITRRHQKNIGAGLDEVGEAIVIADDRADAAWEILSQGAEHVLVAAVARAKNSQQNVFVQQFANDRRDQVEALLIREATGVQRELNKGAIESREMQKQSAMPEGVVNNLTPEQLADLIAYLQSLQ